MEQSKPNTTKKPLLTLRNIAICVAALVALALFREVVRHGNEVERVARRGNAAFLGSFTWWKYGVTHDNLLPPWDPRPGHLMFDHSLVVQSFAIADFLKWEDEHEGDVALIGPIDDRPSFELRPFYEEASYFYLPYAVTSEEEGLALLDAYRVQVRSGGDFIGPLPAPPGKGTTGADQFFRSTFSMSHVLEQAGAPNRFGGEVGNVIPVIIERPTDKTGDRLWMVSLSQQAVLMPYPGEFPMTKRFLDALAELERDMKAEFESAAE